MLNDDITIPFPLWSDFFQWFPPRLPKRPTWEASRIYCLAWPSSYLIQMVWRRLIRYSLKLPDDLNVFLGLNTLTCLLAGNLPLLWIILQTPGAGEERRFSEPSGLLLHHPVAFAGVGVSSCPFQEVLAELLYQHWARTHWFWRTA